MPAQVTVRAERVLMNISTLLRTVQSETYASQDRLAGLTDEAYKNHKWVLMRKPIGDTLSMAAYAITALNPSLVPLLGQLPSEAALKIVSTTTGAATSLFSEPASAGSQAELQKLQAAQSEIASLHSSLQSMIQTHEAALQRLQNMEGANRQA